MIRFEGAKEMKACALGLALLLVGFVITGKAQERKMKIYISADMEGVVGVVTGEQLGPQGFEYARFREFMTQERLDGGMDLAMGGRIAPRARNEMGHAMLLWSSSGKPSPLPYDKKPPPQAVFALEEAVLHSHAGIK